jgi:DNA-binding Xre family transcriptional regulator
LFDLTKVTKVEETKMDVSYNKLWKLMIDKGINKSELRSLTGIGTNTLAKLSKNQQVSMDVLMKICSKLNCDISDICEFIKEN